MENSQTFFKQVQQKLSFAVFLWYKLPAAFWSGVRLQKADESGAVAVVPFKRFSQNPFGSTYFACLSMAAELSTGILVMAALHGRKPSFAMLVVKNEAEYYKKAVSPTYFTCTDYGLILQAIDKAKQTGEAQTIRLRSIGKDKDGNEIAQFWFTWSIKERTQ